MTRLTARSSHWRSEHGYVPASIKSLKDNIIDISLATVNAPSSPKFAIKAYNPSVAHTSSIIMPSLLNCMLPVVLSSEADAQAFRDVLNHVFLTQLRNNVSWVNFKDRPLNLRLTAWIMAAA